MLLTLARPSEKGKECFVVIKCALVIQWNVRKSDTNCILKQRSLGCQTQHFRRLVDLLGFQSNLLAVSFFMHSIFYAFHYLCIPLFMHSIIYAFHYMWCICGAGGETLGRLKKGFRRPLCAMRTITLCFDKANRTYVCWHPTFFAALKILFCEQVSDSRIRPTRLAAFFCFECKK